MPGIAEIAVGSIAMRLGDFSQFYAIVIIN
jgi:predicted phage gp36 major capsid-like protein